MSRDGHLVLTGGHFVSAAGHMVSPAGVAAALNNLYDDRHRGEVADRCHAHATQERLQWSVISEQWSKIFREVLAAYPAGKFKKQ